MCTALWRGPFRRKWILVNACFTGVGIVAVWAFIDGILSPRGFGVAGLVLGVGYCAALVLVVKGAHQQLPIALGQPGRQIDEATRKLLFAQNSESKNNHRFDVFCAGACIFSNQRFHHRGVANWWSTQPADNRLRGPDGVTAAEDPQFEWC